jgi:hypothetical protein
MTLYTLTLDVSFEAEDDAAALTRSLELAKRLGEHAPDVQPIQLTEPPATDEDGEWIGDGRAVCDF